MPTPKRERKRQNAAAGRAAQLEAARAAKKKQTTTRTIIGVGVLAALVVLFAFLSSRGGDDDDVATGDDASSTTTASTVPGAAATTGDATLDAITCNDTKPEKSGNGKKYDKAPAMTIDKAKKYVATFETSCGTFKAELDAANAPMAANNFVFLAKDGFFDGLKWHRVVKDFVIQGGDPEGTGGGGPGYDVTGEAPKDGYKAGHLAAAKTGADPPGTMGSQFFVVTSDAGGQRLTNDYARFGIVTEGLDVARKLGEAFLPAGQTDAPPNRDLYILKVSIVESAA